MTRAVMGKRWCFVHDNDGHLYLIPWGLKDKFYKDMETAYDTDDFTDVDWVDKYRSSFPVSSYSFFGPVREL